jgi:biopolymer transport protein ExbD
MKNLVFFVCLMFFALNASTILASELKEELRSENLAVTEINENNVAEAEVHPLEIRIREIREMDKSELTTEERQELRKELRDIKEEARQPGGAVYISVGALVVLLLLILLLR